MFDRQEDKKWNLQIVIVEINFRAYIAIENIYKVSHTYKAKTLFI